MPKFVSPEEAAKQIKDGAVLFFCCFGLTSFAEEVAIAVEKRFLATGHPCDLTIYSAPATGNYGERGAAHFAHEGMTKRLVTGHFGGAGPAMGKLISENKIEAYNFPQGVLATMSRNIAAKRPGILTKVGLYTFVDPRIEGGKTNQRTTEDLIEIVHLDGEEWMYYHLPKVDVAFIRGNVCDEKGNLANPKDGILVESLSVALAARSCGGIVIAETEFIVEAGSLHPKQVRVPGTLVDYVVQSSPENHWQTMGTLYNPAYTGDIRVPLNSVPPMELDVRKVISRRSAMELVPNTVINLGIGIPEGVSFVIAEENVSDLFDSSVESGVMGGVSGKGLDFANAINPDAIIEHAFQFDLYDSGSLDISCLGLAQADEEGNVNVSKFNNKAVGCGGFINITQNTKNIVFCGTFTAGGLDVKIADGQLHIAQEGRQKKFIKNVEQITFSAKFSKETQQNITFITERAVFKLSDEGLELTEIAPGVDLEKDVLAQMEFRPLMKDVKLMPEGIFRETWGELAGIIAQKHDTTQHDTTRHNEYASRLDCVRGSTVNSPANYTKRGENNSGLYSAG